MQLTQEQLALIHKIVNARLTKDEMQAVTQKAEELLTRRFQKNK